MNRTIFLICNPVSGKNSLKKIRQAIELIKNRGLDVHLMLTSQKGDAEIFAKKLAETSNKSDNHELPSLIIAVGGDGTYNEVINGIADTNLPMAILPLGTTNVLGKELNIPENIEAALDIALTRDARKVSLGKITFEAKNHADKPHSRYFCLMAGIGYDAAAVYGVNSFMKKYSGKTAYIFNGLKKFILWNPDMLVFSVDVKSYNGYSAIISNVSKYAGNFQVAPDARIKDNALYSFIMHGSRRMDILKYAFGIIFKKHLLYKDITYAKAEKIFIKGKAPVQIDGDYAGSTPASIEAVPNALNLVY
ncbi:MAG: diacylglycerol kinase family lipid kinase [Nitrospiraceae bacterium]|nr:diacylglycerol kinase family lipid kinase [Nitrospiraceae bacterium]